MLSLALASRGSLCAEPALLVHRFPYVLSVLLCAVRTSGRTSGTIDANAAFFPPTVRASFKQLFELADGSFAKHGLSVKDFMGVAESFHEHLGFHHGIEEQCVPAFFLAAKSCCLVLTRTLPHRHIFPVLAKRMPQFRDDHQEEHDAIHKGTSRACSDHGDF